MAGQSLSFPEMEKIVGRRPLFSLLPTTVHSTLPPFLRGYLRNNHSMSVPGREGSLQHTCCLYDHRQDKHRGFSGTSSYYFLVPSPPPSAVSVIILASKDPMCPKWQSAISNKDGSGKHQLFCPAWREQSVLQRQDRGKDSICSATS